MNVLTNHTFITVTNVNPVIRTTIPATKSIQVGSPYSLDLYATDEDANCTNTTQSATWTYDYNPNPITATINETGVGRATFAWTPLANETGQHNVTFNVTDGRGNWQSRKMLVTVYQPQPECYTVYEPPCKKYGRSYLCTQAVYCK